jgi:thymidylate synthase
MNSLDKQYQTLLQTILDYGVDKSDRTGTGTKSIFGYTFRYNMEEGFPLLTTKKMAVKTMMTELKWFLKGDTNIKYLVDNGCNIWNGDAYKNYCMKQVPHDHFETEKEFIELIKTDDEFARKWGELGPIYGKQWRDWNGTDQIQNLIKGLKENPDSRRHMVSAWNVGELDDMTLPPCHYGFQCYTTEMTFEERATHWAHSLGKDISYAKRFDDSDLDDRGVPKRKLSLMWNQRSVDTFLGLPFNIASYGTLLLLLCEETGYEPGELIGNLGDVHLYKNHIEQTKEQLSRDSFELPQLELRAVDVLDGEFNYTLVGYQSHPTIKAPLSN